MVYDAYGCKAKAIVIGGLFNAGTTFLPDGSGVVYTSTLNINGFSPGATLTNLNMLQNICLNMEHSYMGDLELRLIAPGGQNLLLKSAYGGGSTDLGEPIATGPVDGSASSTLIDPGVGYDYCFNQTPLYGTMVSEANIHYRNYTDLQGHTYSDYFLPAGTYVPEGNLNTLIGTTLNGNWTVWVMDHMYLDNGYIFNWSISFVGDLPDSIVTIHEPAPVTMNQFITNATCGDSNGGINISVAGTDPPFTYLWSTGAITEDIFGIPAGTYTVIVKDANLCETPASFSVSNSGTMALSANVTPVSCNGNNTGAINITPSGGAQPYTFLWSNAATTEDMSALAAGSYTVTVTDQNSCHLVRIFNITTNPAIQIIQQSMQNEQCGTHNGSISINATGGTGSFGYAWSNGSTSALNDNLIAGTYTVTVTDAYACTATQSFNIVNDVSNCAIFCYLDISGVVTDELCGNGNGAINITVADATPPYNVHWSTGATTEDIAGLHQGSYTVTVTDVNQCEKIRTYTVGNNTGNLTISSFNVINETCGTGNGSIDITVGGGSMPYSYNWSNAQHTQDITDLSAFNYTVTITDANNCSLIQSYTVSNNAGNLQVSGFINDEICSADNGSITQTVSGGFGNISYLWSNNSTQQSLQNIPAGTYTCNITDQGGCNVVEQYTVVNLPGNLAITGTNVTNEICSNHAGTIQLSVAGTNPIYHWNNNATTSGLTGLAAGTYSCTITNPSGCTVTTGPIYVFNAAGTLSVSEDQTIDEICGNGHGAASVNVSGGTLPYTYLWSTGSTSQNIFNLHTGTYTVTVTDSNGCTYPYSAVVLNQPGTLTVQNAVVTNENCGNGNGAINLMITGSTAPYTYHWTNGATTQDLTSLHADDYSVTITSNQGCTATWTSTVNNIANGMSLSWQITNEICSNGMGSIDLMVSGGNAPYTYVWSDGPITQDRTTLSAGSYVCTVTDNTNCHSFTDTIEVNNHAASMHASTTTTNETCGNSQGSINLTVTGGALPLTFLWSNTATTEDLTGLATGTYSYTVTDANDCIITGSAIINNLSGTLNVAAVITDEHCNNNLGAINLTVSGGTAPYDFLWSGSQTSEDLTALSSGNFSCTITDDNGCNITTGLLNVADNPGTLEIASMIVTNEVCDNNHGQINMTVSGGTSPYTYLWSNALTTQDLINLTSGTYSVTVSDNGGCSVLGHTVVSNINGAFSIVSSTITDEHCDNGQGAIDLFVQGGTTPYTYVWSNGASTQDLSNISAGNYSVYVSDNGGCTTNGIYAVNNQGSLFQITHATLTDEVCGSGAGAINITHSGGTAPFLYHWSNGALVEDLTGLAAGTYSITITDVFGCTAVEAYTLTNNPGTMVLSGNATDESCGNGLGAVNLNVFGGAVPYDYSWNNGAISQDISGLHGGTYSVTVSDAFGCAGFFSANIINNTGGFMAAIDTVIPETCGIANGSVQLDVSGGQIPYDFSWNNGATTEDISGLAAGIYNVQVTDDLGCSFFLSANLSNQTGSFAMTFSHLQDENCDNGDGFIDIEISGGSLPYTYIWSNSETTQDITDLFQGDYHVTITDATNCHIQQSFHINNANATNIQISGLVTDASCAANNGSIDLTITGGMSPMIYSWNTGSTNPDIINLAPGTYTIVVADDAGCSNHSTFLVQQGSNPNLDFAFISVTNDYCSQGNGSIYFDGIGGSSYTYYVNGVSVWSPYVDYLTQGTYLLEVVDENGCSVDTTINLGNDLSFTASHTFTNESCNQHNGSINVTASGPGLTYQWSNGLSTQDLSGLDEGTYSCVITDGFCTENITVVIDDIFDFSIAHSTSPDLCGDSTGSVDQTITGGGVMDYEWSNSATSEDINGMAAGTYECTVTNTISGCTMTPSYVIPSISSGVAIDSLVTADTCSQGVGSIENVVYGGSGNYSYSWSHGPSTLSLTGLNAGAYELIITDNADGCDLISYFTIQDLETFSASGIVTNASCAGCSDGTIDLAVVTGIGFNNTYSYEWNNASTTQDQVNLLPGTYCVTITASTGCDTIICFEVFHESGIQENAGTNARMEVYPNPAGDFVNLSIDLPGTKEATLTISNIEHKLLLKTKVSGTGLSKINTADLSPGVYEINIISEHWCISRKLVIMR